VIGLVLGLLLAPFLAKKFKGIGVSEEVVTIFNLLTAGTMSIVKVVVWLG
jgi:hypothetical protein